MATAHHSLAVLTNACVKPPINPQTGLSTSLNERTLSAIFHYDDEYADDREERFDTGDQSHEYLSNLVPPGPANGAIPVELNNLTDDEFYQKLVQLKSEHKKTLAICEKLYKRKVNNDLNGFVPDTNFGTMPNYSEDRSTSVYLQTGTVNGVLYDHEQRNSLRESANRPPTGKPPPSPGSRPVISPGTRYVPTSKSMSSMSKARPSSAPVRSGTLSLARSLEEEVWLKIATERKAAREAKDVDEKLVDRYEISRSETYETPELANAMANIDDMWDNFSIEEYAPRPERPSSASVTRREKAEKEWRHRITIPKPFNMTIREMNKEKKISQIQKEQEDKLQQIYNEEEVECQKKFKAAPVPAHIYLPMYDEIMEKGEARRRYIREYSKELLMSQEKPFHFMKREADKRKHRRVKSAPVTEDGVRKSFKAKPVPVSVFDNSVDDKIMEEEEYRKIRIKMRSEELLKVASLPPNMEARKQFEDHKKRVKQVKSKRKSHFQPKVNHEVPDYDELYRHFQKELARRKRERESTVVRPFQLNTMHIKSKKDKIIRDMEKDEENLKENRWPYQNPRITPRSLGKVSILCDIWWTD